MEIVLPFDEGRKDSEKKRIFNHEYLNHICINQDNKAFKKIYNKTDISIVKKYFYIVD